MLGAEQRHVSADCMCERRLDYSCLPHKRLTFKCVTLHSIRYFHLRPAFNIIGYSLPTVSDDILVVRLIIAVLTEYSSSASLSETNSTLESTQLLQNIHEYSANFSQSCVLWDPQAIRSSDLCWNAAISSTADHRSSLAARLHLANMPACQQVNLHYRHGFKLNKVADLMRFHAIIGPNVGSIWRTVLVTTDRCLGHHWPTRLEDKTNSDWL